MTQGRSEITHRPILLVTGLPQSEFYCPPMGADGAFGRAICAPLEGLSWRDQLSDKRLMYSMTYAVARSEAKRRSAVRLASFGAATGLALS